MSSRSLDSVIREKGFQPIGQTQTQNPNDDLGSQRGFFDYVLNSVEYHDSKIRQKFKDLEFPGIILLVKPIKTRAEIEQKTSKNFVSTLVNKSTNPDTVKYWEVNAHITEVSGLLPQPTMADLNIYKTLSPQGQSKKANNMRTKYEMLASRFPKFYCISETGPKMGEVWKVKFPDENFFYYGTLMNHISVDNIFSNDERTQRFNTSAMMMDTA